MEAFWLPQTTFRTSVSPRQLEKMLTLLSHYWRTDLTILPYVYVSVERGYFGMKPTLLHLTKSDHYIYRGHSAICVNQSVLMMQDTRRKMLPSADAVRLENVLHKHE